jgi:hypothetical protein
MRLSHRLLSTPISLLAALVATPALATPGFPDAVQSELALSYSLQGRCSLCHDGSPSSTTVTQPFGIAMRKAGLVKYNDGSVATALAALVEADSDCDGTTDTEALQGGYDPNDGAVIDGSDKEALTGGGCADAQETPAYGCGAQIASGPVSAGGGAAASFMLLGLSLLRRRSSARGG